MTTTETDVDLDLVSAVGSRRRAWLLEQLQGDAPVRAATLAERLGVAPGTIYRDFRMLRTTHPEIEALRGCVGGFWIGQTEARERRLAQLLERIRGTDPVTAVVLAAELGVSVDTIHRDMRELRAKHPEIQCDRGRAGGYWIETAGAVPKVAAPSASPPGS